MKRLLVVFVVILFGFGQAMADLNASSAVISSIEVLRKLVEDRSISRVEVYNMPWYAESVASFTADRLKANAQYKLSISYAEAEMPRWGIANALKKTKEDKRTSVGDLRWGFIFFDREKEVFSVYATGKCKEGVIQGRLVKFDPSFWLWVKQRFGAAFDQDVE